MKLKLTNRQSEAPDVETFVFEPERPIVWQAGQFLHYVLHHRPTDDRGSDRWFTIASAPFEGVVKITTRFTDNKSSSFKNTLKNLKIGDYIEASEVEGDFVLNDSSQEYVFIAGGIGITPFISILKDLDHENKHINATLIYGNRDHDIVFKDELEEISRNNPNLKIQYVFSPEQIDENLIRELIEDITKPIFYISGPEPMVETLGNTLQQIGVKADYIKQDWFPGYTGQS